MEWVEEKSEQKSIKRVASEVETGVGEKDVEQMQKEVSAQLGSPFVPQNNMRQTRTLVLT